MIKRTRHPAVTVAALLMGAVPACGAASLADHHGAIHVARHEVRISRDGAPDARVLASGGLLIGRKPLASGAAQHNLCRRYYQAAVAVVSAGEATGRAGGHLAQKVIGSLFSALWHDDSRIVDRTAHTQAQHLQGRVDTLCTRLSSLKAVQDRLAVLQPAFAP